MITEQQLNAINQSLCNDEYSMDDEIKSLFMHDGVPEKIVTAAISFRNRFRLDSFAELVISDGKMTVKHSKYNLNDDEPATILLTE